MGSCDTRGTPHEHDGPDKDKAGQSSEHLDGRPVGATTYFGFTTVLGIAVFLALVILQLWSRGRSCTWLSWPPNAGRDDIHRRVDDIMTRTPLIDGHNDFSVFLRYAYDDDLNGEEFRTKFEHGGLGQHVDIPRLKMGKVGGTFWVAFAFCPRRSLDFSEENYREVVVQSLHLIDTLRRLHSAYPSVFSLPPNSSTALSYFQQGQVISPLALEGLHMIGNSLSVLRLFHALGVRYASITHNCHNKYGDAALDGQETLGSGIAKPYWGGLSCAGAELIWEMNRMGMMVDLAHTSHDTMRDVLKGRCRSKREDGSISINDQWQGTLAPVIDSHANAYTLCPHPRNVPDDVLHLVRDNNGIVMVSAVPELVSCNASPKGKDALPEFYPPNSTLERVVDHISYIVDLIGVDHVGLGSDFDGIFTTPRGLEDVSKWPGVVAEMLRRGFAEEDVEKIIGRNILRVWAEADAVATRMQLDHQPPRQDHLPHLKRPGEPSPSPSSSPPPS